MISLIQMEYIVAVDKYRHYVTASEKCFITQPTLSMQIKKAEETLGVEIFDRKKHPVQPTPMGERLIEQMKIVLQESEKIKELIHKNQNSLSGLVNIGIIPTIGPYLMPAFLSSISEKYPNLSLNIKEQFTHEIIENLKNKTLDIGIISTPIDENEIKNEILFYEKMLLYIHKNHPYFKEKNIYASNLKSEGLWLLGKGHCFRTQILNLCAKEHNIKNKTFIQYESGSLETIKNLVKQEGGYSVFPELAINSNLIDKTIKIKSFVDSEPVREISLIYHQNFTKKKIIKVIKEEIMEIIPDGIKNNSTENIIDWDR